MITKVTEQNSVKYQKLFREAEELLKSTGIEDIVVGETIDDLYEYFIAFPSILNAAAIKDASDDNKTGDPEYYQKYFTILPLDEPVFEINADTRAITIPQQFKSIGVTGDNIAEIVFFSIDRFFDAVDFGAPEIEAVIEWHRTTGDNQDTYVDKAYIKELTLKENKVLIGWVIDERITEEPGTIEFAVRLVMKDEKNEIIYSFSTSAAKVNINKTLNFYPDATEIDNTAIAQVKARILATNSPDVSNENSLNAPVYNIIEDDGSEISTNIDSMVDDEGKSLTYSYISANDFYADFDDEDNALVANVKARSANGKEDNRLLYRWFKWNENDKNWQAYPIGAVEAVDGNQTIIDSIGKFKCVAIDNVGIRRATKDSQILHILGPQKPEVKITDEGKYTSIILTNEADGMELSVKPGHENNAFYVDNYDINNKTKLSYEWKKSNNLNDTIKTDIEDAYEQKYQAKEEGYYYGYAITQRNLKIETSDKASVYRVTKPLIEPTLQYTVLGLQNGTNGKIGETIEIDFNTYNDEGNVLTTYAYDTIDYQWYRSMNQNQGDSSYQKVEDEEHNHGQLKATDRKILFTPKIPAAYRIKLLVKRNGQSIPEKDFDENDSSTWPMLNQLQTNGTYDELTISMSID